MWGSRARHVELDWISIIAHGKTTGAGLLVQNLKTQGVDYMFSVVGYPVPDTKG